MSIVTRTTRLIHSDSGDYPLYLTGLAKYAPNTMWGMTADSDDLIELGIEVVIDVPMPSGDVVVEGPPVLTSGDWYRNWIVRSFTPEEILETLNNQKEMLRYEGEQRRVEAFAMGFPYEINGTVYHIQVRDGDRSNISDLRTLAKEAIAEDSEQTFTFRVYENVSVVLTAPEMVAMAGAAFLKVTAAYQVAWDFKDALENAQTVETLPALPEEFFTL